MIIIFRYIAAFLIGYGIGTILGRVADKLISR